MFRHKNLSLSLELNPKISGDFRPSRQIFPRNEPLDAPVSPVQRSNQLTSDKAPFSLRSVKHSDGTTHVGLKPTGSWSLCACSYYTRRWQIHACEYTKRHLNVTTSCASVQTTLGCECKDKTQILEGKAAPF